MGVSETTESPARQVPNKGREPVATRNAKSASTMGETAFMDALIIIGACWAFLLFAYVSLRHHSV